MSGFGSAQNHQHSSAQLPKGNPFARALPEIESKHADASGSDTHSADANPFAEAMKKASGGNRFDTASGMPQNPAEMSPADLQQQQEDLARKEKLKAMRRKLHDQINPVDMHSVYNSEERKVKREIDQIRAELKMLAKDVAQFDKEIELTLMTEVTPGKEGNYFKNFFAQLRSFIMLLRQKIKSASTWAHQTQQKNKKKKRKGGAGLEIKGGKPEQTKTVFDMMHHERSSTYSSG